MNLQKSSLALILAMALPCSLGAAQISGKVTEVAGNTISILTEGGAAPAVGDKAKIFFKLGDTEVLVASARVTEAALPVSKATIDKATGSVEKDQLVRIETTGGTVPATAIPTKNANSAALVLEGSWTGKAPENSTVSFRFQEDGNFLWLVTDAVSGATTAVRAKYLVDTSVTPNVVKLFAFQEGELKGATLRGFFELQSDGRLKIDLSEKQEGGFSDRETLLMSRAIAPIVRPSPIASSTPTPDTRPLDEQKISLGHQRYEAKDYDGAIKAYTEAIKLNSKNASAYKARGHAFHSKDDYDSAMADWNKAIALDPSYKEDLGWLIKNLKYIKEEKKDLEKRTGRKL